MPPWENLFQKTFSLQTTDSTQINYSKNFDLIYSYESIQIHFRSKILQWYHNDISKFLQVLENLV